MGKTYGEKPIVFRFEENGEEYMIGSEVLFHLVVNWDFPVVMLLSRNHNKRGGANCIRCLKMPVFHRTYIFFTLHFFNIPNKSIIFISKSF